MYGLDTECMTQALHPCQSCITAPSLQQLIHCDCASLRHMARLCIQPAKLHTPEARILAAVTAAALPTSGLPFAALQVYTADGPTHGP